MSAANGHPGERPEEQPRKRPDQAGSDRAGSDWAGRDGAGRGRREFLLTLLVVLAGAVLVLLAAAQPFAEVADHTVSVPPAVLETLEGQAVAPAARALGLVGLAAVVALAATRRIGRRIVGFVLVVAGLGVMAASLSGSPEAPILAGDAAEPLAWTYWPWVSVTGGGVLAAGGLLVVLRAGRWPEMGRRYDAPTGDRSSDDPWTALDRGEDPTT